ncbi:hypothetical protein [Lysobacter enzymogenes]|uniref:hypothetical protein n=1 Tax=Lysobacter enzymogenes TaxID=69 RepID=UPI001A97ACB2|nr:hypothetical protein [Lysobacter enzymogenes]QQP95449.1 hypothetical protein JHW38_19740 [Lysobacter enzymogenes]
MNLKKWRTALCCAALLAAAAPAAARSPALEASDVARFWTAYDAVRASADPAEKRRALLRDYIDPGTPGLRAFMQAKGYTPECYLDAIERYPKFWNSLRADTLALAGKTADAPQRIEALRRLYPPLRPATVYFAIGCLNSSGTTLGDKVLIGAELAAAGPDTDVSELPEPRRSGLRGYFATRPSEALPLLLVHEYVHTQQKGPGPTLLAQAIYEGAADFVAERATGQLPPLDYVRYGRRNEARLKRDFRAEMHDASYAKWLYNAPDPRYGVRDLGYYMGYAIVRDYYARAADRERALREIVELDCTDQAAVEAFLARSGFYADEAAAAAAPAG